MTIHDISVLLSQDAERVCAALLPEGKRVGQEWTCGDVTGAPGDSMAVQLTGPKSGLWHDKATDEGGDLIDLIAANKMLGKGKAAAWAREFLHLPPDDRNGHSAPAVFDPLKQAWRPKGTDTDLYGKAAWAYHDAAGNVNAYVIRFELPGGRKDIIPIRLLDGRWQWKGWTRPELKPLFNLHRLTKDQDSPVLVVEGEKTAVAAQKLFPDQIVITWQGGANASKNADWSALIGRRTITLWPDADRAGVAAMEYVKCRFSYARMVDVKGLPDGWDLADPVPEGVSIRGLFDGAGDPPKAAVKRPAVKEDPDNKPYRCLGHADAKFYYLSTQMGYVVPMGAKEHTELPIQMIARDDYWKERGMYEPKSNNVDWKTVGKTLMAESMDVGVYDASNVRGLGCWLEGDKVVYHAGDHLIVDGDRVELLKHRSKWIYPSRTPINIDISTIAGVDEIKPLLEMAELLPWHTSGSGWMLAAACFLAPICGVLAYRASPWLIGPSGSGKSYTQENVIIPLIGHCINVKGETTAVGIRQKIGCDALPTAFDEIEAKDAISSARIRSICELARGSSTETGGSILKGSPSGHFQEYGVRSMFFFSSIAMGAIESADETRMIRLEFKKRLHGEAEFKRLKALINVTSGNPAFCRALIARSITFAARIRAAAELFGEAIRKASGDARKGQQFGAVSAAYWYLQTDGLPTMADADRFAAATDWNANESTVESDPGRATDILLQAKIDLLDPEGRAHRLNVGEVLETYYKFTDLRRDAAWDALMRIGIHPIYDRGECIDVALRHTELQKIFAQSPFADRWSDYFRRIDGAEPCVFTPKGSKTIRAIRVPKEAFVSSPQPELITQ